MIVIPDNCIDIGMQMYTVQGFRKILRNPGFTAVALLSLAVGIGSNTAVFTLVEDILFRELPYQDADALVEVYLTQEVFPYSPLSYPDYLDVREATGEIFQELGLGGYTFGQVDQGDRVEACWANW